MFCLQTHTDVRKVEPNLLIWCKDIEEHPITYVLVAEATQSVRLWESNLGKS